jgi:hypothetical protein
MFADLWQHKFEGTLTEAWQQLRSGATLVVASSLLLLKQVGKLNDDL